MAERVARTSYERISDAYARHVDGCRACGTYGTLVERCPAGDRLLGRMAAFWRGDAVSDLS